MASESMVPELRVRLLGTFGVQRQGLSIRALNGPRLQSVFANLVIRPGVPRQRRQLAATMWPEATDEQSQTNLRTLLHRLRTACPWVDQFLWADRSYLLWDADYRCWTDVVALQAAARGEPSLAGVEEAIRLYAGDLLPGADDPWIDAERQRLRRLHLHLLDRAIELHESSGGYQQALEYAQRSATAEPFNEENQRRLIRLHALSGDRAGGMRAYEAFASVLQRELATEPEATTREAYRRLRAPADGEFRDGGAGGRDPLPRMIGRTASWEFLRQAWNRAQAGEIRCVAVGGEAGLGKTRLVEEFANWAERQGIPTARGRAYRMSGGLVYAPVVPWVRRGLEQPGPPVLQEIWLNEVARVVPGVAPATVVAHAAGEESHLGRQERFFEALARAVLHAPQPLLLLLDDVQWCDPDLLGWLRYLLAFDPTARLLLLFTWRSDEARAADPCSILIADLERDGVLTRLELEPLDAEQSAALAAEVTAADGVPPAPTTYAIARGNPLFLIEMVRAARGGEAPGSVVGLEGPPAAAVPPTVRSLIAERLERLSPDERELVDAAAALGRGFDVGLLTTVSDASGPRAARALDELCARRILIERSGDVYDFHHDLVREVAYADLGKQRRRQLHRAVADALAEASAGRGDRLSEIAVHYDRAGLAAPAISYYLCSARRMSQIGATVASIAQLERAATLAEQTAADADLAMEIREQLGDLLHVTARYGDARLQFELATACSENSLDRARLRRKIARTRTGERDFRQAAECLNEAREILHATAERGPDWSREWLQVSLDRMGVLYWTTDWKMIGPLRLEIGAELDRYGTPAQRRQFRFSLLGLLLRRDRLVVSTEMLALARENLESAVEDGSATAVAVARFQLAYVLLWSAEPALAEDQLVEALALAERTADRTLACRCLAYLCVLYRRLQLPQRSREYAALALDAATALGNREYRGVSFANQAWLSWKRGRLSDSLEDGRMALAEWSDRPVGGTPFAAQWLALWPLLASSLRTGSGQAGLREALEFARRLLDGDQARLPDDIDASLAEALAAAEEGDRALAERHLAVALQLAGRHGYL